MTTEAKPRAHQGQNIRHFREEKDLSQEAFADLLGNAWTQKKISQLEAKSHIDANTLEEVAKALEVSVEEIREHREEMVVNNIQNNYEGSNNQGNNNGKIENYQCNFNPLDKLIEAHDEIKKLYAALIKEKDEKIALLNKMLGGKN
jgi:transcriptional regulator with XRE-family HTH domain